ncbi:MAG TPA: hypothetical protein PLF32_02585 [Bacteroidales bacterium]|nr:hypothetical protein [Bacteroidales bacterium]HOR81525.1 hypothetical protein [Bacteroidales bacterium]HPJ90397.1 hypothetical protein [Bacteroidales bacterium]HQB19736.1 hypothetical protein [Bacteroidales bacterium]
MKTLKQTSKLMSKSFFFFVLLLSAVIFTACVHEYYYGNIYYYDFYAEGYVYYRDTNLPVKGLEIILEAEISNKNSGLIYPSGPNEVFYTDSNGYYRLRFVRYLYGYYPIKYYFNKVYNGDYVLFFHNNSYWLTEGGPDAVIPVAMIHNAKQNIQFDTIKLYQME